MTKKELEDLQSKIVDLKSLVSSYDTGEQNYVNDILKSIMILENKISYYLSSYTVLNVPKKDSVGKEKSQIRSESQYKATARLTDE